MADNMEVIVSAIDEASEIFRSIVASCEEMMSGISASADEASVSIDEIAPAAEEVESAIASIDPSGIDDVGSAASDAASGADELGDSLGGASDAADQLGNSMGIIEGSLLLGAAEQIGNLAGNTEDMAQQMNTAAITIGQLATQTGIAEPQMVALINEISNATFPNDEAMMYVKSLSQIGVSANNLGKSATDLDKINDAFGMGAGRVNSLGQELSVLGVDMNNVSDSFNALAYANANTVGGMDNYYNFLKKYDAQFKDLGYDVDQSSIIIAAATQKYGGGRAALSGLSEALEQADGDTRKLEQALGIQAGTLDNASAVTGQYEGQLQELANEEAEHKTILDQIGAAWEDVSLSLSGVLSPAASAISLIGQVGSLGMSVKGIKELTTTFNQLRAANIASTASNYALAASQTVLNAATTISTTAMGILSGEISLVTIATEMWNAVLAMNPLILVAVAAVALAVAVYEVGKAFGWWTDVSSMLDAIWAGVNRLWQAFINHPDVQAILSVMSQAWNVLSAAVGKAISWVMSFFQNNNSGKFDVVRTLIDALGVAWQAITLPIRTVINVIKLLWTTMRTVYNNIRTTVNNIRRLFSNLPGAIRGAISSLIGILTAPFRTAYSNITGTVSSIKSTIQGITHVNIGSLTNKITQPVTNAYNQIAKTVSNIINKIKSIPSNIPGIGGAFGFDYEGMLEEMSSPSSVSAVYSGGSDNITLDHNINLLLDLRNVPEGMSERELADLITSKRVISELVNSADFQSLDSKVKTRLALKSSRARGV